MRALVLVALVSLVPLAWPAVAATAAQTLSASATVGGERVNINTASVKELMTLAGVGRRVAEKIVEYRDAHGPFKKPEDLRKVQGVGAGLFEKNRERIAVK